MVGDQQNSDPWKRAQEGPFTVGAAKPGLVQQPSGGPPGAYAQTPASPPPQKRARRITGATPVVVAAGFVIVVLAGIVMAVYFYVRSAGRAVTTGVGIAERAQAEITLDNAYRAELGLFATTGRFTDDVGILKSQMPNVSWEKGLNPRRSGAVYLQVCDANAATLLLQTKTEPGTVFAMWASGAGDHTYFALGPISCPSLDDGGAPPTPWASTKDEGWRSSVPGEEGGTEPIGIPPPAGGPRAPNIPNPYGSSAQTPYEEPRSTPGGGGGSNPYGGSGSGGYVYP